MPLYVTMVEVNTDGREAPPPFPTLAPQRALSSFLLPYRTVSLNLGPKSEGGMSIGRFNSFCGSSRTNTNGVAASGQQHKKP